MKKFFFLALLSLSPLFAIAKSSYLVNSKLYLDGKLIATPTVIAHKNQLTQVAVENSYSFQILVTTRDDKYIRIDSNIKIGEEHYNPSVITMLGDEASVEIGDFKLILRTKPDLSSKS